MSLCNLATRLETDGTQTYCGREAGHGGLCAVFFPSAGTETARLSAALKLVQDERDALRVEVATLRRAATEYTRLQNALLTDEPLWRLRPGCRVVLFIEGRRDADEAVVESMHKEGFYARPVNEPLPFWRRYEHQGKAWRFVSNYVEQSVAHPASDDATSAPRYSPHG